MKLLMITSRNIDKKGGENALIVGRHQALYSLWKVETDVLFWHKDGDLTDALAEGMKFLPSQKKDVLETIKKLLSTKDYQGVVISGFYNQKLNELLQELKKTVPFMIGVDIHATIREIYEYCIPDLYHILGTRYLYLKKKQIYKKTLQIADYAFVVSDESVEETNSFCKKNHIQYMKIRCGCQKPLNAEQYLQDREAMRRELGVDENTLTFVYSGSKSGWQKYAKTVKLFEKIAANNEKCKFAFYMNLDDADKAELARRLGADRVVIRWVKPEQMLHDLAGYDVGILLRDKNWTNKVAFPNKFSDYIHSGLALVMTDAISEPYRIAKEHGLDILTERDLAQPALLDQFRAKRLASLSDYVAKCGQVVDTELLYRNQVAAQCNAFVEQLRNIEGAKNND